MESVWHYSTVHINQLIRDRKTEFTLADPFEFNKCLENHLGLSLPAVMIRNLCRYWKALEDKAITAEQLRQLREAFCKALAIQANGGQ